MASEQNQSTEQSLTLVGFQGIAYDDIGFAWTCGLWDPQTLYVNANYDDCQLFKAEAMRTLEEVLCTGV